MPLTGPQLKRIRETILAAYKRNELTRVLMECMEVDFDAVVAASDFSTQVFELVRWADQQGHTFELVKYVYEEKTGNPELQALYVDIQTWGISVAKAAPATPSLPAALPSPAGPHQIFLSYSHRDIEIKDRLLADLTRAGLSVWTDDGLEPGTSEWQRAIEQAVRACQCLVVILSPNAKQSKWVNIEISYADDIERRIFPALALGARHDAIPIALYNVQYVDLRDDFTEQVRHKLLPALSKHLNLPPPQPPVFGSPIEFSWVTIPAGEFLMGSDSRRDRMAESDELPQHLVYLPEYRIAKFPITNHQYFAFVQATGHRLPRSWRNGRIPDGMERHPVTTVSWWDAHDFCAWASAVNDYSVRLPTEPEWEKAARGTDGRIWPWGNQRPGHQCNFNNYVGGTSPVDAYPFGASPFGVFDMVGNVLELTDTTYQPYPLTPANIHGDPQSGKPFSLRGGTFLFSDHYVRCAYRNQALPNGKYENVGFRVISASLNPARQSASMYEPLEPLVAIKVQVTATTSLTELHTMVAHMQSATQPADARLEAGLLAAELGDLPPDLDTFVPVPGHFFRIGKYPVTNAQFQRFMEAGGYQPENEQRWWSEKGIKYKHQRGWIGPRLWYGPTQPVVGVSWYEVEAYCTWLNESRIGLRDGETARLPTRAQWVTAARGGRSKPTDAAQDFPWRGPFATAHANTEESDVQQTTPVHMYPTGATPEGVFDLSGNVWEWTQDSYAGVPNAYVLKGGAWYWTADEARISYEGFDLAWEWSGYHGFRVVVAPLVRTF